MILPATPPTGMITGGWGYVWVAYGVSLGVFAFYGVRIWLPYRSEQARNADD